MSEGMLLGAVLFVWTCVCLVIGAAAYWWTFR